MNNDDLPLLHELEPLVEENLNRHLAAHKPWNPHDYVPWSVGRDRTRGAWLPEQSPLPPAARDAMVLNLLTEDNLPSYHREIAMAMGMDGPWGQWVNRWTAEENRHGIALRDYLVVTRAADPIELEKLRVESITRGFSPGQNGQINMGEPVTNYVASLPDAIIYVTFQELATRVSHRNTGIASNDPVADRLLAKISADENLHMIFYRNIAEAVFDIMPNRALLSLYMILRYFKMPGFMIPGFRRRAVAIAAAGIYDIRIHADEVVKPLLRKLRIFERDDFTGDAEFLRDELAKLMIELDTECDKFDASRRRYLDRKAERCH